MKIGIIGGGQLGMMMAEAAHNQGHQVIGLDPTPKCPLSFQADTMIQANYDDVEAINHLASQVDVITYEFENVSESVLRKHQDMIPQKIDSLTYSKHRKKEKDLAKELGIETPAYRIIKNQDDIDFPSIIKTTMGGYDGKGQFKVMSQTDIDHIIIDEDIEYILEEFIDFDYEISVIATRSINNEIVYFPVPRNTHRNGILFVSEIYNDIPNSVIQKATSYTKLLIEKLDYVGTLAVEFFVCNERVVFNEFAPRPHNSGHYTIEGCTVSQFDTHIEAITGVVVTKPELIHPTVMINELGQDEAFLERMNTVLCTYHNYHKSPRKDQRKMAHITCAYNDLETLIQTKNYIIGDNNE